MRRFDGCDRRSSSTPIEHLDIGDIIQMIDIQPTSEKRYITPSMLQYLSLKNVLAHWISDARAGSLRPPHATELQETPLSKRAPKQSISDHVIAAVQLLAAVSQLITAVVAAPHLSGEVALVSVLAFAIVIAIVTAGVSLPSRRGRRTK